jgi:hypothetical protein
LARKIQRQPSQDAAEGRAQSHRDAGDRSHRTECARALSDVGKGAGDQGYPARRHESSAGTLDDTRPQEHGFARSHSAGNRCGNEHRISGQHASPATEAVGERAGGQEGAGECETVGVDDPGHTGDPKPDILRDRGHGDHDGGHVEQDQKAAETENQDGGERSTSPDDAVGHFSTHTTHTPALRSTAPFR